MNKRNLQTQKLSPQSSVLSPEMSSVLSPQSLRVKICGITNLSDAEMAVAAGADFLGLILVPESPRSVRVETAREIVRSVAGKVRTVGVFRNQARDFVTECIGSIGFDYVQLHGCETPDECLGFSVPVIKALEISPKLTADVIELYRAKVEFLLFDRPKHGASPEWLAQAMDFLGKQNELPDYFFAGGLTAENVKPVAERLNPFGIDVASGVEKAPGMKDKRKVKAFFFNLQSR
ncbi:MAG: phosphoribosylanthranilate isomerase [Blastocatellia bacterium]|nr:phosphoribosylanthranilate isomerase [Blastocatellia bacterium]